MANASFPPRWHETVRRHVTDTIGYVAAQTGTCLDVQAQELKAPRGRIHGRDFKPLRPQDLPRLVLAPSWFMGIIVCPGDDMSLYLNWYANLKVQDRERVVFFVHPAFAIDPSDEAWGGSLPPPRTQRFNGSWENFHQLFGRRHADRVYEDHPPNSGP